MPQSCGVENEAKFVINTFLGATHAHPSASGPQHAPASARDNITKRRFVSQTAGARHRNRFLMGGCITWVDRADFVGRGCVVGALRIRDLATPLEVYYRWSEQGPWVAEVVRAQLTVQRS